MKLSEFYEDFITTKMCEGRSPNTIESYDVKIKMFINYLNNKKIEDLTVIDVRKYILHLQNKMKDNGKVLTSGAVQTYVRHLRAYLNYSYQKKITNIDWLREIKLPKAEQKVEEILNDDEIVIIFASMKSMELDFYRTRALAITSLLLDTGIRASEVCSINYNDVNFENNYIKIKGKGSKERLVKLTPVVKRYIYQYLRHRRIKNKGVKALFVRRDGDRITYETLKRIFINLRRDTCIERLHMHLCRHTFATRKILVDGVDPFNLQVMLGHTTLDMVRKYSHLSSQYQVAGVEFKPLAMLIV